MLICAAQGAAATDNTATAHSATVRDGSHDFDFIYGKWRMPNHRLKTCLAGSHLIAGFSITAQPDCKW
jgi:hypothetical protein